MARRTRPSVTARSEHWLRLLVNRFPCLLNDGLRREAKWIEPREVIWLSPLKDDDYAEYYDGEFLDRMGLNHLRPALQQFWPQSGPRWDGLGRTSLNDYLLVEAKAYPQESFSTNKATGEKSIEKIKGAFSDTKNFLSCLQNNSWDSPYYQYANRLAHLYWLNEKERKSAYLVCVYFVMATDVPNPTSTEEWAKHIENINGHFGIDSSALNGRIINLFIPTAQLQATVTSP